MSGIVMNMDSMASYRAAGALCEEYDPDEVPERRTRCSCGAFLPSKPTFEGGEEVREYPITEWRVRAGVERDDPEDPHDWEEVIVGWDEFRESVAALNPLR